MKKRGQVTIFIIIGIVVVAGVFLFVFLRSGLNVSIGGNANVNANSFLSSCLENSVRASVQNLSLQGGYDNPQLNIRFMFSEEKEYRNITYLCYTNSNFVKCINQKPTLVHDFAENVKKQISNEVANCFGQMIASFNQKGFDAGGGYGNDFDVNLTLGYIQVIPKGELILTKSGETTKQDSFKAEFSSRILGILQTAEEIVNRESNSCEFDYSSFAITYPEYSITRFNTEATRIYTLIDSVTNEKFRFAVRGCIIPNYL